MASLTKDLQFDGSDMSPHVQNMNQLFDQLAKIFVQQTQASIASVPTEGRLRNPEQLLFWLSSFPGV
jgi:hypothetical protein